MSTVIATSVGSNKDYPTSDGRPMAETDLHRTLMLDLIETLKLRFETESQTYVSGNLLIFYEPGNKRRHIAPDVFVVKGVPKHQRLNYLVWEEGKVPNLVIELTSKTTRREDRTKKWRLYEEVLQVSEYFLFDPYEDYLMPPFQAFRLETGKYVAIEPTGGRFHSTVINLDLVRHGPELRLHEPGGAMLLAPRERVAEAADHVRRVEQRARQIEDRVRQLEAENKQLREEAQERLGRLPTDE